VYCIRGLAGEEHCWRFGRKTKGSQKVRMAIPVSINVCTHSPRSVHTGGSWHVGVQSDIWKHRSVWKHGQAFGQACCDSMPRHAAEGRSPCCSDGLTHHSCCRRLHACSVGCHGGNRSAEPATLYPLPLHLRLLAQQYLHTLHTLLAASAPFRVCEEHVHCSRRSDSTMSNTLPFPTQR
jgi:hypothetical protein